ncbi:mechanosensitive ion channel family protein [Lewinella sp. W8]|uniref:mechanosensitive ion channel family protein n=1 Tax=Lewinella sp. W8 TaxID=2528208 RepID=UPI001068668F|nr:mechanosensitive ion channel domain-containing protein [Lewinella sp. W8]MTB49602.1 mechanosensitive ion channel [Lewinella sp. W8]
MEQLLKYLEDTELYVRMAALMGVALLIALIAVFVVYPILRTAAKRTDSFVLEAYTKRTKKIFFWLIFFLLTVIFWSGLGPIKESNPGSLYYRPLLRLDQSLLYIFAGLFAYKLVNVAADFLRHIYNADDVHNLRERKILTQLQYVQRIAAIVIFIVVIALLLLQFESMRNLGTGILTSAGIGGIIIGIAAQKSIANLLAGFQIAFTQPIRLDDALIVQGEFGWVEDITLTYVSLRLWDQRRLIVPLQHFIDSTFQNWTRTNSELIGTVFLYLDYTFPVEELRQELDRYLLTQELWDERTKAVQVTDTSEKTMTLRILVSSNNAGNTFTLRCNTREHLIQWVQQHYPASFPRQRVALERE